MTLEEKLNQTGSESLAVALQKLLQAEELVDSLSNDANALEIEAWSASIGWRGLVESAEQQQLDPTGQLIIQSIAFKIRALERSQVASALYGAHDNPELLKNLPPNIRRFYVEAVAQAEAGLRALDDLQRLDADLVDPITRGLLHWHAARASVPLLDLHRAADHYEGVVMHLPESEKSAFALDFLANLDKGWPADAGSIPELSEYPTDIPPVITQNVSGGHASSVPAPSRGSADTEYTVAWICTVLGMCFIPLLLVGLYFSHVAITKGRTEAKVPKIIGLVYLGLVGCAFLLTTLGPKATSGATTLLGVIALIAFLALGGLIIYGWSSIVGPWLHRAANDQIRRDEEAIRRNEEIMRREEENRRR